jgi:hypothetical protein
MTSHGVAKSKSDPAGSIGAHEISTCVQYIFAEHGGVDWFAFSKTIRLLCTVINSPNNTSYISSFSGFSSSNN